MKRRWMGLAAALICAAALCGSTYIAEGRPHRHSEQETVLVVGGSMAHGWLDARRDSYLRRAFAELSSTTPVQWQYVDRSRPGERAVDVMHRYPHWLLSTKPQVVAIAWGLLNDCHKRTPMARFKHAIHAEIDGALARHAVVMLVTPPVTEASSSFYRAGTERYLTAEMEVAHEFRSPNVHVFDILSQMRRYMAAHGQTYWVYYGNSWHPNSAGHRLAGQLLYRDIVHMLGRGPIVYVENPRLARPRPGGDGNASTAAM
ncbi:SGNH/GDSL hydrolase family protein [Alicyclobacillus shizuokensis]|uniref:SGNH/GDSL hydrolase family protein n=1 Tax=Alicyclobacillus shizuokensis TaxID=392014 RepID=UPI00082F8B43|nr:SGNH/GDSL hydrolase family protein [Alicyclobacillus shizuokensis]